MSAMYEFETTIELAGAYLPALITYELDPSDGHPLIEKVEAARLEIKQYGRDGQYQPHVQRHVADVTALLEEWQLTVFEGQIADYLDAQATRNRIDRYELERAA
ncbi:MAG: hypothetical protein ABTR07_18150 [Candidatus Competibacter denitrificans]